MIDYRDRIGVMTWAALFVLAVGSLMSWEGRALTWQVLGSPITLQIDREILLSSLLILIVCSGTEATLRCHPLALRGRLRHTWVHWGLPGSIAVLAVQLMPSLPGPAYLLGGLLLTGLLLGLTGMAAYHTLDTDDPHYHLARIGLNAVVYTVTLVLFLIVYRTRARSLISATLVTAIGTLLALELLRGPQRPLRDILLYAGVVGILLGEATWALNYWRTSGYTAGLLLLLFFYFTVGLGQHSLAERLTRRVLVEYAVVAFAGLMLIGLAT